MKNLIASCITLTAASAGAADWIKASITTTNGTTNGMTITVKGSTRTWTNNVVTPSSHILTNSTAGGTATNLFNHFGAYNVVGVLVSRSSPTNLVFEGLNLTASVSAGWASLTLSTNTATANYHVAVPFSNMGATNRTNIASLLVTDLATYATNNFSMHSLLISNLMRLATNNNVTGSNVFSGTNLFSHYSNRFQGTFTGQIGSLSNGTIISPTIGGSPVSSNLVNYGSAISSPGTGTQSEEFGQGATATANYTTAVGGSSTATAEGASAFGRDSGATGIDSGAFGSGSQASGEDSFSFGGEASALRAMAIGNQTIADDINSVALGFGAETTRSNQVVLGSSTVQEVFTPGFIWATLGYTNALFTGTNNFRGDVAYQVTNVTSLANGNNAGLDFGNKIYCRISGNSAAASMNGIAGGRDGRLLILENTSGQSITVANDSGVDPVAANRIYTGTGSDVTFTNANAIILLIYDPTPSRWILINQVGTASVGLTGLTNVGGGFAVFDSNAGSVAQLRTFTGSGIGVATNAANVVLTANLSANQFELVNGTNNIKSGAPLTNISHSGIFSITNGGLVTPVVFVTNDYQATVSNTTIVASNDNASPNYRVSIPTNAPYGFEQEYVFREDQGFITVTNARGNFLDTSGEVTSYELSSLQPYLKVKCIGSNWVTILRPTYP